MSAFLMGSTETLSIATAIKALRYGTHELLWFSAEELATAMFRLNAQSVHERYEGRATETHDVFEADDEQVTQLDARQLLEQLQCWLYQSCEGTCVDSPLYQVIEVITGRVAQGLLRQIDDNARFGTPLSAI